MSSSLSCRIDHSFPWKYHDTVFDAMGHMICPSCRTELERAWSMRTIYVRGSY